MVAGGRLVVLLDEGRWFGVANVVLLNVLGFETFE